MAMGRLTWPLSSVANRAGTELAWTSSLRIRTRLCTQNQVSKSPKIQPKVIQTASTPIRQVKPMRPMNM